MRPLYGDAEDIQERAQRAEELARHAARHEMTTTKPIAETVKRPQLVHGARQMMLARLAKYNDPRNLEWDWDDINDKWERHAFSASRDLLDAEEKLTQLRKAAGDALEWIEASLDYDDLAMDGSRVMVALREALTPKGEKL